MINHFEYVYFNILVLLGPFLLSFDRKVRFVRQWPKVFLAVAAAAVPFLVWDILVTGRHWWFNSDFLIGIYLFDVPLEEWLFFITVPFASLFIWEVLRYYYPGGQNRYSKKFYFFALIFLAGGIIALWAGKEYTAITGIAFAGVMLSDRLLKTHVLLHRNIVGYLLILMLLMAIFNGYLTARPVVLYQPLYQLNWRLLTIPIEDFFYGYTLILLATLIYEKLRYEPKK